jgi:replicative DNA helicase
VIANTGGASTLLPEWYDILKEIPKIYVCYDNDKAGQRSAREIVAKRLGFGRVFNIKLPEDINDVNEFFCKGGTKDEFDRLIEKAKIFSLPGVLSIEDALAEVYRKSLEGEESFLYTPWKKVNKLLGGGLRKKDLIVIGAPPKIGKTTFSLQISVNLAKQRIPVLFFCLEMPFETIAKLVVCMNEGITEEEFDPGSAGIYAEGLKDIPLYLGYEPRITSDQLVETFRESQNRYGIQLAVFDNLHWLIRSTDNVVAEIGLATRMFKTLAMDMDIPIILIAQPRKLNRSNKPMNYWDLKDSSAIPADADILCILHRNRIMEVDEEGTMRRKLFSEDVNQSFENATIFRVDAGRLSSGGQTTLDFRGEYHTFFEYE